MASSESPAGPQSLADTVIYESSSPPLTLRYGPLLAALERDLPARDRWCGIWSYRRTFYGAELLRCLQTAGCSDAQAVECAGRLLSCGALARCVAGFGAASKEFSPAALYQCLEHANPDVLNAKIVWLGQPLPAAQVARRLQEDMQRMKGEFLTETGVDYDALRGSADWAEFLLRTTELQAIRLGDLDGVELKAFAINLYNVMVVHANVAVGHPKTALARKQFFYKYKYNLGGHLYALDDLEHGILRQNRKSPGSLSAPFGASDPRAAWVVRPFDPRIHFALNCGAVSCPPIRVYTAEKLDQQLTTATRSFMSAVTVNTAKGEVSVSKLLSWYYRDFGTTDQQVLTWVREFLDGDVQQQADAVLASGKVKLTFQPYNWDLNKA